MANQLITSCGDRVSVGLLIHKAVQSDQPMSISGRQSDSESHERLLLKVLLNQTPERIDGRSLLESAAAPRRVAIKC